MGGQGKQCVRGKAKPDLFRAEKGKEVWVRILKIKKMKVLNGKLIIGKKQSQQMTAERCKDSSSATSDSSSDVGSFLKFRGWRGECSTKKAIAEKASGNVIKGVGSIGPTDEIPSWCTSLESPSEAHLEEVEQAYVQNSKGVIIDGPDQVYPSHCTSLDSPTLAHLEELEHIAVAVNQDVDVVNIGGG